jgi:RsiW-degrading membrane proteinase PrsW (M82 family)
MSPTLQHFLIMAPVAILPVLVLLAVFMQLDSYKVVMFREVAEAIVAGAALAAVGYVVNGAAISALDMQYETFSHTVGPVIEESLKALFILFMIWRNRIGFMIDAAIVGFAVGTGFAVAENLYALSVFQDTNAGVFLVRGFGTAVMHGGSVAFFGVLAQSLTERYSPYNPLVYLPGLLLAIALHVAYNLLQAAPFAAAAAMLVAVPATLFLIFGKSEHKIHTWLIGDYQSHEHLLADIENGEFTNSRAGRFIQAVAMRFRPEVPGYIFAYLKLHTELVLRAEQISLSREKGEPLPISHDIHEKFLQLHTLEKNIGRSAMLALWPHLHFSRRELWELHELDTESKHK